MRQGTRCAEMGRDSAEAMFLSRGQPSFPSEWRPYLLTFYGLPQKCSLKLGTLSALVGWGGKSGVCN